MQDHVRGQVACREPERQAELRVCVGVERGKLHDLGLCGGEVAAHVWRRGDGVVVVAGAGAGRQEAESIALGGKKGVVAERFPHVGEDDHGHVAAPYEAAAEEGGDETDAVDELRERAGHAELVEEPVEVEKGRGEFVQEDAGAVVVYKRSLQTSQLASCKCGKARHHCHEFIFSVVSFSKEHLLL